jgi:hypothetical protein
MRVKLTFLAESIEHDGYCFGSDAEYVQLHVSIAVDVDDALATIHMCPGSRVACEDLESGTRMRPAFEAAMVTLHGYPLNYDDGPCVFYVDQVLDAPRCGYHWFADDVPEHMRHGDCTSVHYSLMHATVVECAPATRWDCRRGWIRAACSQPA